MGAEDVARQAPNVGRMELLGARVSRWRGLAHAQGRDERGAARRGFRTCGRRTTASTRRDPYPELVAQLQSVIGEEARAQILAAAGALPDGAVACVGGGSNAIGLFRGFLKDADTALYGVEAAGHGIASGRHAATLTAGRVGILHGSKSYVLATDGQITEAHSVSAGLDYPGVGPEHAWLKDTGRAPTSPRPTTGARRRGAGGAHGGHPAGAGDGAPSPSSAPSPRSWRASAAAR